MEKYIASILTIVLSFMLGDIFGNPTLGLVCGVVSYGFGYIIGKYHGATDACYFFIEEISKIIEESDNDV